MSLTNQSDDSKNQSTVLSSTMHNGISPRRSQSNNSSLRIIYPREELLKYKSLESSQKGFDNESMCTNSKVLFKILKPGCKSLEKILKPYYNHSIVLGPQKRPWNIGCHVSQVKRSQNDSFAKGNKGPNENKFTRGEYKRDSKGNSGRFTTGSGSGFTQGSAFGKDATAFKYHSTDSFNESEAEPEWFTEGPETINDTVELGLCIDDGDIKPGQSPMPKEIVKSAPNPSDIDSAILSLDKDLLPSQEPSTPSEVTEADLLKLLSFPKKTSNEGSRILKFLDNPSPECSAPKTNAGTLSSADNSSPFVLRFPIAETEIPITDAGSPPSTTSQPSAADLSTMLRDLVLGGTSTSPLKSIDVPKVSSKSSLFSSVPTVGQIEAAALTGTSPNIPNSTRAPGQPSRGRSILETLHFSDNSLGSPRPRNFDPYAHSNMTNWAGSVQGNMMANSSCGSAFNDQLLLMGAFDRLPNRQMNISSRDLPNDPAIAHQLSQRRPVAPNISDTEQTLVVQNRQVQQLMFQQSPFCLPNYRSATPNSSFHSSPSMETALSQLKGSLGAQQNSSTPPNSLFSSKATLRGGSGNSSSNQFEQVFHSLGRGIVPPMDGFYVSDHQSPQLRQNGSAPNLLPPTANPTSAIEMFLSNHENNGFDEVHFSSRPRPTTSSDLSSAMRRRLS